MRALSEPIARMANHHDECTGRFWEGRFKAQRITDEAGLLACAMYVDLNPVRAAMAETPEQSKHTSAYDRIKGGKGEEIPSAAFALVPVTSEQAGKESRETKVDDLKKRRKESKRNQTGRRIRRDAWLAPLQLRRTRSEGPEPNRSGVRASNKGFLTMNVGDYLQLLDWTGRQGRKSSPGKIPAELQPIFDRLGIDGSMWCDLVWYYKRYYGHSGCAGTPEGMASDAQNTGRRWSRGQRSVAACFTAS